MRQGCPFSDSQIRRIVILLKTTDMAMTDIAAAMSCARGSVAKINQRYKIRNYGNRRTSWQLVSQ